MKEVKTIFQKENPLFKRKEIQLIVEAESTPSYIDTLKFLSEKFSTKSENIRIKNILGKLGVKEFTITAKIYDSEKDKNEIEPKSKKEQAAAEKSKQEEAPQEKLEIPTEQPKSESTEEPGEKPTEEKPAEENKLEEEKQNA